MTSRSLTPADASQSPRLSKPLPLLLGAVAFGLIVIILRVVLGPHEPSTSFTAVVSALLLLAGASLASGVGIGFLFGIPKSRQRIPDQSGRPLYDPNTNLEDISDWLTKIIV